MKMNIKENDKIFSETCIIKEDFTGKIYLQDKTKGEDKYRLDKIRKYFKNLCKDTKFIEFFLKQHKYIVDLFLNGILNDEYINICKQKATFKNDRAYYDENNNLIKEDWYTCFFLLISKLEEISTLYTFNKNAIYDFYLEDNLAASDFSKREATADPDFLMKNKNNEIIAYVEQKVIKNNDKFNIRIRTSQYTKFNKMINEGKNVYILCKYENIEKGYDVYYFYDYKDLKDKLVFNQYTYKYETTNFENIPIKFFANFYIK